MRLGDRDVGEGVYLAPMAGYSDKSFRRLCRRMGADVLVTEMVSAKALYYRNQKTWEYLDTDPEEDPVLIQLFGSEPELMGEVAAALPPVFAGIDINMGCPAPKVFRNHEGSALLKEPDLIYRIVHCIRNAVSVPVTVKIRKGISEDVLAIEAALAAQEGGASAVALHGRTAAQMYQGKADWAIIAELRSRLSIPLIGNGDIRTAQDAVRMKQETGCAGIMIGRAARGNPWLFREVQAALAGKELPPRPDAEEVCDMVLEHARMCCVQKGEATGMLQMRSQLPFYIRGLPGSTNLRQAVQQISTLAELEALVLDFRRRHTAE